MNSNSPKLDALAFGLLSVYSAALAGALLLASPWWLPGLRRGGKYRNGFAERLGRIPRKRLHKPVPGQTVVWVHAVSVGEVLAATPLIQKLRSALPQGRVFVSTTTCTGQAIARARFGEDSVFYFPADFAFAVRAWLRYLQPQLLLLVESEFWPRVLFEADRAHVPVSVVNARISSRSWPRYRRLRRLWRPLLRTLVRVQTQTEHDADCLRYLGAHDVSVGGNLKYDVQPVLAMPLLRMMETFLPQGIPVIVCGSTLEGEEYTLLSALPKNFIVILAPRHPERFEVVAALLAGGTRPWLRLSGWRNFPQPIAPATVLLLDSLGELASIYALATIAIVGGGLLHMGGHNPLEPALLGKPVVIGPNAQNFIDIVVKLHEANAILITDSSDVAPQINHLLQNPEEAVAMGKRAQQVSAQHAGATGRALTAILALVKA